MKKRNRLLLLGLLIAAFALSARAAETPVIALSSNVEDGKAMLVATVTAAGKPVENAKVVFFAQRTFGQIALGTEATLDDGTAAVPFPSTLPGDENGRLKLSAEFSGQPKGAARIHTEDTFDGGKPFRPESQVFPRALWAPRAPWLLLSTIAALVGVVWGAFGYVVFQLSCIRKEAASAEIPAADLITNPAPR